MVARVSQFIKLCLCMLHIFTDVTVCVRMQCVHSLHFTKLWLWAHRLVITKSVLVQQVLPHSIAVACVSRFVITSRYSVDMPGKEGMDQGASYNPSKK